MAETELIALNLILVVRSNIICGIAIKFYERNRGVMVPRGKIPACSPCGEAGRQAGNCRHEA